MTHYLKAHTTGLHRVRLPIRDDSKLLDSEYVDDTALYIQDNVELLERVRITLEIFCLAMGANINWHTSIDFLTDLGASS